VIPNAVHVPVPFLRNARNVYQMPTLTSKGDLVNVHGHGVARIVIYGWVSVTKSVIPVLVRLS